MWNSRNLGQTGCSQSCRAQDPDTESSPLCCLLHVVYLGPVPCGIHHLGGSAKSVGLPWVFLQPGLGHLGRHTPCDPEPRLRVERTCTTQAPAGAACEATVTVSMASGSWLSLVVL